MARHSGISTGHRHCTRNKSLLIVFRQLLQPLPHRLASHERTKKDQRDFPRLRVIRHPVRYLVHCTLNCAVGLGGCCLSGRHQGMGLRRPARRMHFCPASYSENRILESIVEADAINCYFGVLSTPPRCVAAKLYATGQSVAGDPTTQGYRMEVQKGAAHVGGARSWGNLGLEHVWTHVPEPN